MFDCLSICPYVIAYEKIVNFLFLDSSILLPVLLEIIVYCYTGCAIGYREGGGVQVMHTCISFKFREYQAYHPLPTKQGLKVIVSEHSHLAAKTVALCKVTKWQVQNLG